MDNLVNTLRKLIESVELYLRMVTSRKIFPYFEAESFLFSNSEKTKSGPHIRDSVDIKSDDFKTSINSCYIFMQ